MLGITTPVNTVLHLQILKHLLMKSQASVCLLNTDELKDRLMHPSSFPWTKTCGEKGL